MKIFLSSATLVSVLLATTTPSSVVGFTSTSVGSRSGSSVLFDRQQRVVLSSAVEEKTETTAESTTDKDSGLSTEDEEVLFGEAGKSSQYRDRNRPIDRNGNILEDTTVKLNPLLDRTSDPMINKLHTMRDVIPNCPQLWARTASIVPSSQRALLDEHLCDETIDVTFAQMDELVKKSANVFQQLGVSKGSNVAILGENSAKWLMVDHGIQMAGGASAVRGADAPIDELRYIYEHSDSKNIAVLQGPRLFKKLANDAKQKNIPFLGLSNEAHGPVKTIILMHREKQTNEQIAELAQEFNLTIHVLSDLLETASPIHPANIPNIGHEDLATIVYTSGTTGNPKGVMLTHGNLLHQIKHRISPTKNYMDGEPLPGETMVSLLPVWHITERTFELWMASRGCNIVYSSIRTIKNDLLKHKPQWMVLVPRVLEKIALGVQDKFNAGGPAIKSLVALFTSTGNLASTHKKILNGLVVGDEKPGILEKAQSKAILSALAPINALGNKLVWSKVRDGFGGRVKVVISGGSALAGSLETFYETVGMNICVGYGLTECSPLISYRRADANLVTAGCAGKGCSDTELRIVDPEAKVENGRERPSLPIGEAGVVLARGPQVMRGYYKNPEATAKAVDQFGWFDSGDLGRINPATGDLILTGRAKDTIVLSNGENIEPGPIEDAILGQSPLIEQIMLTGQDGRRLVAILVLRPEELSEMEYYSKAEGKELQKLADAVNDPKCSEEDAQKNGALLSEASGKLRQNSQLKSSLLAEVRAATKVGFRSWEQVNDFYITLEPFAMSNGQLTQSYKVKRQQVLERYADQLPK